MKISKAARMLRRESVSPSADFNQRIRAGIIGAALIFFLLWVAT